MKNIIFKKTMSKIIAIVLVVGTFVGLFYWYQIRPARIRKKCAIERFQHYHEAFGKYDDDGDGFISTKQGKNLHQSSKFVYNSCLQTYGLK